jgi:hypothetical protein
VGDDDPRCGDDLGQSALYADTARGGMLAGAAATLYAEEWMGNLALAIRAGLPLGPEGGHR